MTDASRPARALFLTVFAVLACAFVSPAAMADEHGNAITVRGTGVVTVKPDQAELSAGVVTVNASAAKALNENTAAVRRLFKMLSEFGVPTGDVQTRVFSVTPQYRPRDKRRPRRIAGYQVVNQLAIVVRDLDLLGVLLDDLVKQQANRISGIRFSIAGADQLADEARQKAVLDARRKAKLFAKAAGVNVGKVMRIVAAPIHRVSPILGAARVQERAVPVAPGEQDIRASVTVTYAIE